MAVRVHRSELAVPGSNRHMVEKAPEAGADVVFLDLEDAVAPADKESARENVITALLELDWSRSSVSVRINGLDTAHCYRDVVGVVERAGHRLDAVLVPKVGEPADLHFVATLLGQIEEAMGIANPVGIYALIETAAGVANVEAIARSVPERLEAMVFGVADYAASIQAPTVNIGGADPAYAVLADADADGQRFLHWGDAWHFAMARIAVACRAHGLRPIDGPYGDFTDADGYVQAARRAAALGYEGKWAIHPTQVPLANDVFTPDAQAIERARRIVDEMRKASTDGRGAVSLDGRLVDAASIRMAENLLEKMAMIGDRDRGVSQAAGAPP